MTNYEKELLEELESGTALVVALAGKTISPEEFLQRYDNFYYFNALDGHEASESQKRVLDTVRTWCALHQQVQDVVNLVYRSEVPLRDYEAAGRIRPAEAGQRIAVLANKVGVADLLEGIQTRLGRKTFTSSTSTSDSPTTPPTD